MKEALIKKLAEKCWLELGYYDVVNERLEEIDYELIVDCVLRHLREEARNVLGNSSLFNNNSSDAS